MKKIKKDTNHRNIVPAGGFVKNIGRRGIMIAAGAIFLAAGLIVCLSLKKESNPVPPEPPAVPASETPSATPETPAPLPVPSELPSVPCGAVAAGDGLSFGLSSVGLMSYIGYNNGQAYCYDWRDVKAIAAAPSFTVGLTKEGRLFCSGSDALRQESAKLNGITAVCCSSEIVYALSGDGRVIAIGARTESAAASDAEARLYSEMLNTGDLNNIRLIAAGSDFFIAVEASGKIHSRGNSPELSVFSGHSLTAIAACGSNLAARTEGGLFLCASNAADASASVLLGAADCKYAFTGNNCFAYVDYAGRLHTDCELADTDGRRISEAFTEDDANVVDFSCAFGHALVLSDDGTVHAFGSNDFCEGETASWRLRPYLADGGFVLGLAPDADPLIRTGDEYTLENGNRGTAVILGDINMDGSITAADADLLAAYLSGNVQLDPVQLQAANILRDAAKPNSVDAADVEQLRCHLSNYTVIDQYAKSFRYSEQTANAERTNADTVGYIKLDGTNIDAPLMFGPNFYYHYHDARGNSSSRGSIYLYYGYPSQNMVISGHNLRRAGIMLHQLHKIQNEYAPTYGEFKNRLWTLNLFGETHTWEVFAMYEEKPASAEQSSQYYNCNYPQTMESMTSEQISEWITYQQARTELDYSIHVTPNDRFLTVLTCADQHWESNLGGRIYFFLRMVDGH